MKVYYRVCGASENGINKDMCDAKLLPTTVSAYPVVVSVSVTYWRQRTVACVLLENITYFQLPTLPNHHPIPSHLPSPLYMPLMILQLL